MKTKIKTIIYQFLALLVALLVFANVPVTWFNLTKYFQTQKFGSTITTLNSTDVISNFPSTYNTNLANLNADKFENNSYGNQLTISSSTVGSLVMGFFTATSTATSTSNLGGLSFLRANTTATSTLAGIQLSGGCVLYNGTCLTNAVTNVSNSDTTLTISPTTGNVVASLNLNHANTWTASQTFPNPIILNSQSYNFPNTQTASGTVLGTDNAGGLSWINTFDQKLFTSTTQPSTSQSASTSVMSVNIPANTLGTNNAIKCDLGGFGDGNNEAINITNSSVMGIEFAYGTATTTVQLTGVTATLGGMDVQLWLMGGGATNSQKLFVRSINSAQTSATVGSAFNIGQGAGISFSADSTQNQPFSIVARQFSGTASFAPKAIICTLIR